MKIETKSLAFDECFNKFPKLYKKLCQEGVSLDNPVAHHKYSLSLIFSSNNNIESKKYDKFNEAKKHLEKATEKGFNLSYFMLSRLLYEHYNKESLAFSAAQEGSMKGDNFSKCLLGSFITRGIGTEKNRQKGVELMLESGVEEVYQMFSTYIGLYYIDKSRNSNDKDNNTNFLNAFKYFERAYKIKKTKATINNYGLCFLNGVHVEKDIEKAKRIFTEGADNGDPNSMYHLAYILEDIDYKTSLMLYKKAALKGHKYAHYRYSTLCSNSHIMSDKLSFEFIE